MTVPGKAVTAAYAAYQKAWLTRNQSSPLFAEHVVRDVLEAAAPAIREPGTARIAELEQVAREILCTFTRDGHPGHPCKQTSWIEVETIDRWRKILRGTP